MPNESKRLSNEGKRLALLTFMAEAETNPSLLRWLSRCPSAVVREGAVLGMAADPERFRSRLSVLAAKDPSPGVREAAMEALDDA